MIIEKIFYQTDCTLNHKLQCLNSLSHLLMYRCRPQRFGAYGEPLGPIDPKGGGGDPCGPLKYGSSYPDSAEGGTSAAQPPLAERKALGSCVASQYLMGIETIQ